MSRDLREYTKSTQLRLVVGFLLVIFLVGDGLIFFFYGRGAGLAGLICLLGTLIPVSLVVLFLWVADRAVKKQR
ncbi:MAG: hypothetical protein ACK2TT_07385 [Anaerolineales bacterium]